jgi:hypothetical protein
MENSKSSPRYDHEWGSYRICKECEKEKRFCKCEEFKQTMKEYEEMGMI